VAAVRSLAGDVLRDHAVINPSFSVMQEVETAAKGSRFSFRLMVYVYHNYK
jgi:hypothetical protein